MRGAWRSEVSSDSEARECFPSFSREDAEGGGKSREWINDHPEVGAEPQELPASNWVNWALSMVTSGRIGVGMGISVLS